MNEEDVKYTYRCYYRRFDVEKRGWMNDEVAESNEGLWAFKDGFWINEDKAYTKVSDCRYWIPPSAINYIEKVKDEKTKKD